MAGRGVAVVAGCGVLALAAATVVVIGVRSRGPAGCAPLGVATTRRDVPADRLFDAYGDADTGGTHDTWTGGDGTHSVRLPDGRTLWIFDDTFLGPVNPPDALHPHAWRSPGVAGLANSIVVQAPPSGMAGLVATLHGGTAAHPTSWLPGEHAQGLWRWPTAAVVSDGPGARVLRVFAHRTSGADKRAIYGTGTATEIHSFTLPGLRPLRTVTLPVGSDQPGSRVLYGGSALRLGHQFYVYGNTTPRTGSPLLYLARVPVGSVADPAAWRYDADGSWTGDPAEARPLRTPSGDAADVSTGYSVLRHGGTYLLMTMDPAGGTLRRIATYWGCSPSGPWHGPRAFYTAPETAGGGSTGTVVAYNPQFHPEWSTRAGVLISYDVNDASTANGLRNVQADVTIYRPRFLRIRLGPPPAPTTTTAR